VATMIDSIDGRLEMGYNGYGQIMWLWNRRPI